MYTQKKPIDNVHIVRERDRRRFRELLAVFALGLPIGLFLLLFTWQNLEVIRLGHEATRLSRQRKEIDEQNKRLQFQLDQMTALESVEQRARNLGFEPAPTTAIVMVHRDGGSPSPASVHDTKAAVAQTPTPVAHGANGGVALSTVPVTDGNEKKSEDAHATAVPREEPRR